MSFNMFIDDMRLPHDDECVESGINLNVDWVIIRDTRDAISTVKATGRMPDRLALDHDLGELPDGTVDTVPVFLKWLANEFYFEVGGKIPEYTIHSANPVGAANMRSFMESWKKACEP